MSQSKTKTKQKEPLTMEKALKQVFDRKSQEQGTKPFRPVTRADQEQAYRKQLQEIKDNPQRLSPLAQHTKDVLTKLGTLDRELAKLEQLKQNPSMSLLP